MPEGGVIALGAEIIPAGQDLFRGPGARGHGIVIGDSAGGQRALGLQQQGLRRIGQRQLLLRREGEGDGGRVVSVAKLGHQGVLGDRQGIFHSFFKAQGGGGGQFVQPELRLPQGNAVSVPIPESDGPEIAPPDQIFVEIQHQLLFGQHIACARVGARQGKGLFVGLQTQQHPDGGVAVLGGEVGQLALIIPTHAIELPVRSLDKGVVIKHEDGFRIFDARDGCVFRRRNHTFTKTKRAITVIALPVDDAIFQVEAPVIVHLLVLRCLCHSFLPTGPGVNRIRIRKFNGVIPTFGFTVFLQPYRVAADQCRVKSITGTIDLARLCEHGHTCIV